MSIKSEKIKKYRHTTKARIVLAMGGACQICGYSKCNKALALHHRDPSQKNFGFGKITANPIAWAKQVIELRKCIVLCHNCHSEYHAGITALPERTAVFNEEFELYAKVQPQMSPCIVCLKQKSVWQKTCSKNCSAKLSYKVKWDEIDLPQMLKNYTVVRIAEKLGCSDAAVHKRIKKLGLKRCK